MQDEIEPPPLRASTPGAAATGSQAPSGRPEPPPPGGVSEEQLWSWVDRDAPELAGHLERHPSDRGRVDALRRTIRAVAAGGPERVPDRIGPYPILRRLGAGGMGVVFEAQQLAPERPVALKVVRGAWLDDERTRRLFRRETEVLARLQHPGIATIFDAGETKEGAPYFVMELVRGEPLDDWARGRTADQKLEVLAKIALAVDHAHEKGVIHRDLKPSNVLVTDAGEPKVLDFGLARIVDPGAGASLTAALSGKVIGTVRYMSPEQAQGLASRVTPASDVYSLGVLAYELLVGRPPHELEGKGFLECARTVAEAEITRPSVHAPEIDRALERVLCRALARDPERRYASASAFADDLERARRGQEVTAPVVAPGGRFADAAKDFGREAKRAGSAAIDEAKVLGERIVRSARELKGKRSGRTVRVDLNPALDGLGRAADAAERAARQVAAGLGRVRLPRRRRRPKKVDAAEPPATRRPKRGVVGAIRFAAKAFAWLLLGWFLFQFAANRYDIERTMDDFLEPFVLVGAAVEGAWENVEVLWRW